MRTYKRILLIPDLHIPFEHQDALAFCRELKEIVQPDKVVFGGDEADYNSISFHDKDPDAEYTPRTELDIVRRRMQGWNELFPEADVLDSNHGSLVARKAFKNGLSKEMIRTPQELLQVQGWTWHESLRLRMSNGAYVIMCHGKAKPIYKYSQGEACNAVQFHFHEDFYVAYWQPSSAANPDSGDPRLRFWDMKCGCLVDRKRYAFHYAKSNLKAFQLGAAVIVGGVPYLIPMNLMGNGRWDKTITYYPAA